MHITKFSARIWDCFVVEHAIGCSCALCFCIKQLLCQRERTIKIVLLHLMLKNFPPLPQRSAIFVYVFHGVISRRRRHNSPEGESLWHSHYPDLSEGLRSWRFHLKKYFSGNKIFFTFFSPCLRWRVKKETKREKIAQESSSLHTCWGNR